MPLSKAATRRRTPKLHRRGRTGKSAISGSGHHVNSGLKNPVGRGMRPLFHRSLLLECGIVMPLSKAATSRRTPKLLRCGQRGNLRNQSRPSPYKFPASKSCGRGQQSHCFIAASFGVRHRDAAFQSGDSSPHSKIKSQNTLPRGDAPQSPRWIARAPVGRPR